MSSNNNSSNLRREQQQHVSNSNNKTWIRGVNLGGWLVQERWISPTQFALTDCHVRGELCWYPDQLGKPVDAPLCDLKKKCKPLRWNAANLTGEFTSEFPKDEYTLTSAFEDPSYAEQWFETHFANFLQKDDLIRIKESGLTHVRVPLPHWILGVATEDEVWVQANRWKYFRRMCEWCRELGLQVWPNIHTAPGSQNGFDNSGVAKTTATCQGWDSKWSHVQRSLDVIDQVTKRIKADGLDDVVTGFGLLNEPFYDCHLRRYKHFLDEGLARVRANLGPDVYVYVSDLFHANVFNDGKWWLDAKQHSNTLLDSHFYHPFKEAFRQLSPRQHVGYVCLPEPRNGGFDTCCFQDNKHNTQPSQGVQRIVTEFSGAYDRNPSQLLEVVLDQIATNGTTPMVERNMSVARREFLTHFIQSQMVAYEANQLQIGQGWFYWSFKIEGGAFAEWDFLRGYKEGWFPEIVPEHRPSEDVYGTCRDILMQTNDTMEALDEQYPPWNPGTDDGIIFDDDLVVTHGASLTDPSYVPQQHQHSKPSKSSFVQSNQFVFCMVVAAMFVSWRTCIRRYRQQRGQYDPIVGDHDIAEYSDDLLCGGGGANQISKSKTYGLGSSDEKSARGGSVGMASYSSIPKSNAAACIPYRVQV